MISEQHDTVSLTVRQMNKERNYGFVGFRFTNDSNETNVNVTTIALHQSVKGSAT